VDRVLAIHMLYHVPDRLKALQEFRRVLRPHGRVVLATNGARYLARLADIHRQAALQFGYTPSAGDGGQFTLEDLELVRQVFPSAERHVLTNALVFREAEPLVRYYAAGVVDRIAERPADNTHRQRLIDAVRGRVRAIINQEGGFRDPKDYGFFVADVP
jgi:SAM-dependent methyltransferase